MCLSHTGTLALIERLSEDYDIDVQLWSDDLLTNLKVYSLYAAEYLDILGEIIAVAIYIRLSPFS